MAAWIAPALSLPGEVARDTVIVFAALWRCLVRGSIRPGARRAAVWTDKSRMTAICVLGRQLRRDGIEIVTLESTKPGPQPRAALRTIHRAINDRLAYAGPPTAA